MVEIVISTKRGTSDEKSKISIINFELKINNSQLGFNNTHLGLPSREEERTQKTLSFNLNISPSILLVKVCLLEARKQSASL
mgnify:CR=1 FL=1